MVAFPLTGVINAVQAALGITQIAANAWASSGPPFSIANYPASLQHGCAAENWLDAGMIWQYNVILNMCQASHWI